MKSVKKKITDHTCAPGIWASPSGRVMKPRLKEPTLPVFSGVIPKKPTMQKMASAQAISKSELQQQMRTES
jgi:hypothetical protein